MRARILPPEEWSRVPAESDAPQLLKYVAPENVAPVVVEDDDGNIVASTLVLAVTHFEGLWVRQDMRGNAGVFRALIRQAYALPQARGESWAFGGAAHGDERMAGVCHRLGGRELPLRFFAIPVGE